MKRNINFISVTLLVLLLSSCNDNISSTNSNSSNNSISQSEEIIRPTNIKTTIYLAGDSTVKTYDEEQYIGGWGQFLDEFLTEDVDVINCANGGRSSRSFINEGRLYNINDSNFNYSFSQNNGDSIEDVIKEGDFLFIQFGHNDDASKLSNYQTIYDRMVPLGEKDENGIYPTTEGIKKETTHLPEEFTKSANSNEINSALTEIQKYGSEYYSYDSGGTYKWYLKQYIDFARKVKATPVLITPVARVKYSNGTIIGGAGLHGENFAYVEAVRQLANEENCLLIDLFKESKDILETATEEYGNYLMALKPNDLKGSWPTGYDKTYNNVALGYTGIEATHYNKYGAFLQAAKVAEAIINNESKLEEYFSFKDYLLTTPTTYVDPSNLLSKSIVNKIEEKFSIVNVTNPNRQYLNPSEVMTKIEQMALKGEVNNDNYLQFEEECKTIYELYYSLNIDDRDSVTNLNILKEYEKQVNDLIEANRPKPIATSSYEFSSLEDGTYEENIVTDDYTIYADSSKNIEVKSSNANATYNGVTYSTTKYIKLGGTGSFNKNRGISFEVTGPCVISIMAKSSGSADRVIKMVDSSNKEVGNYAAATSVGITSVEIDKADTYFISSTSGGVYVYMILIEYYE